MGKPLEDNRDSPNDPCCHDDDPDDDVHDDPDDDPDDDDVHDDLDDGSVKYQYTHWEDNVEDAKPLVGDN